MYSYEQSEQLNLFLLSLGAGFVLGVVYDILRAVRLTISKGKVIIFIFDILYFLIFSLATFLFFLAVNKGEFRSYMIFGEILGFVFYYVSFGIAAKSFTDAFVKAIHACFSSLYKIILMPFKAIFRVISEIKCKFSQFFKKLRKKYEKIQKKHLPKLRLYVYNLLGIFGKQQNVKEKDGYSDEEKKS